MRVLMISLIFLWRVAVGFGHPTICPSSAMPKISAPPSVFAKAPHALAPAFCANYRCFNYATCGRVGFAIVLYSRCKLYAWP